MPEKWKLEAARALKRLAEGVFELAQAVRKLAVEVERLNKSRARSTGDLEADTDADTHDDD